MVNKNIQMKKREGNEWDNLFPITLTENIFNVDGKNIDTILYETDQQLNDKLDSFSNVLNEKIDVLEDKNKFVYMSTLFNIEPNTDITSTLRNAIELLPNGSTLIFDREKEYTLSEPILIQKDLHLDFNHSTVKTTFLEGSAIHFKGYEKEILNVTGEYLEGGHSFRLSDTTGVEKGDTVLISSTDLFNDSRAYYRKGGYLEVENVSSTHIRTNRYLPFDIPVGTATATIYKAITGSVKNLKLINESSNHLRMFGIRVENSKNIEIDNVFIDNYNHLIILRNHLFTTVSNYRGGSSLFEGTEESYGLSSYTGTGFTLKNSIVYSGRHAVTITGNEPSFQTLIINCSFDNEDSNNQHSFDCHQSNYDLTMINCTSSGAVFGGNCKMIRCTFNNTSNKAITFSKYNDPSHANYVFDSCEFVRIDTRIGTWETNPNATANSIGSIIFKNTISKYSMTHRYSTGVIGSLVVDNQDRVSFILSTEIERMVIKNVKYLSDSNFLSQDPSTKKIKHIFIENSILPSRYRAILVRNNDSISINNTIFSSEGNSTSDTMIDIISDYVSINNCVFPSGSSGTCHSSSLVEINGGKNVIITGENVKKVSYI